MSVEEKMTAIADRLRLYNGTTDKLNLDEMVAGIDSATLQMYRIFRVMPEFYGVVLPESFWDILQIYGQRTDYSNMFGGNIFTDNTFKPKYKMVVTNAVNMFTSALYITDLSNIEMDFSQCVNFSAAFSTMTSLKKIGDISTISADELFRTFLNCRALIEVGIFTVKEETTFNRPFANCISLEKITFAGVIGQDLDMSYSPLNKASIKSIMDCLSETASGKTVTLKSGQVDVAFETSEGAADGREVFESLIAEKPNWVFSY